MFVTQSHKSPCGSILPLRRKKKLKKASVLTDGPCFLFTVPDHTTMSILLSPSHPKWPHTLYTLPSFCKNAFNICLPLAPEHAALVER